MQVEIWSDVVCPWCHIGKRRLEAALAQFPHRDDVEVRWRSFELDPGAASEQADEPHRETDYRDRLARKYGTSPEQAQRMLAQMTAAAAAEGLDFRFDRARRANTFDAHQVIHLAGERGVQDAVTERLLTAYFSEGAAVGDREVLQQLAVQAGLDADEVGAALRDQRFAESVRADEEEAAKLGASAVPFFVVDRAYGISGAQPPEQLLRVLERAWSERQPLTALGSANDATACGPGGCA